MIVKCPYCDYAKPDQPTPKAILKVLAEPDLPIEDYMLWIERLIKTIGLKDYNGVKIHIGRKHKGELNMPFNLLTPVEAAILNRTN